MSPLPEEILAAKAAGGTLDDDAIRTFVEGFACGRIGDAQLAAFAMAVMIRGMQASEIVALTLAMRDSGRTLAWDLPGPVLGKHSTGGIGDKTSLVVVPIVAACGAYLPKLSGRGLGHTGGTLDKLEAIPGYQTQPDLATLRRAVRQAGCAIVGAGADIAPADKRLYAIRDVTATTASIPLLTSSILSKKLAEGLDGLVMDVKVGSGAFLPALADARALASSLVAVASGAGLPCRALLTDMDRCLGRTAGNALEVQEALAVLRNEAVEPRLADVIRTLAAELLVLGRLAGDLEEARQAVRRALSSGAAAERFGRMVQALGGPADLVEHPDRYLKQAPVRLPVPASRDGFVAKVDARALGLAVVALGGGRAAPGDVIDPAVGLGEVLGPGEAVRAGEPLLLIHARDQAGAAAARERVRAAFTIDRLEPPASPAVLDRMPPDG